MMFLGAIFFSILAASLGEESKGTTLGEQSKVNGLVDASKLQLDDPFPVEIVDIKANDGWYQFYFGGSGVPARYIFRFNTTDYVIISITDAYLPGDAFDVYIEGEYRISTPRVLANTSVYGLNPNVTFWSEQWSNTRFMLPGPFNLTLVPLDSPFGGGSAFIKADTRTRTCQGSVSPFIVVQEPLAKNIDVLSTCSRIGAVPAQIYPENAAAATNSLLACTDGLAWYGEFSLLPKPTQKDGLGCMAMSVRNPRKPTMVVIDCDTLLPVLCMNAANAN